VLYISWPRAFWEIPVGRDRPTRLTCGVSNIEIVLAKGTVQGSRIGRCGFTGELALETTMSSADVKLLKWRRCEVTVRYPGFSTVLEGARYTLEIPGLASIGGSPRLESVSTENCKIPLTLWIVLGGPGGA